jgi:hypothetical protein
VGPAARPFAPGGPIALLFTRRFRGGVVYAYVLSCANPWWVLLSCSSVARSFAASCASP